MTERPGDLKFYDLRPGLHCPITYSAVYVRGWVEPLPWKVMRPTFRECWVDENGFYWPWSWEAK